MRRSSPHAFDADSLLQRDPDSRDTGALFAARWAARFAPRPSRAQLKARIRAAHAFDAAVEEASGHIGRGLAHADLMSDDPDHYDGGLVRGYAEKAIAALPEGAEESEGHLRKVLDHVKSVDRGDDDPSAKLLRKCFKAALEALPEGDAEDEEPGRTAEESLTAEERHRKQTGEPTVSEDRARKRARDGVGETPPESVVRSASRRIDHRRDFADLASGGADSRYGFDANSLFQRGEQR